MGENTKISWTDHTFNPWIGCTKVSEGCQFCYAERQNRFYGWVDQWGPAGTRKRTSAANWQKPLAWNRAAEREGVRRRVFCASLADVFEDAPELSDWRADLFDLIEKTPALDWLLLTKRPENVLSMWDYDDIRFHGQNIWIGTSTENQERANERIPELVQIPARVRFLSIEPMLGPVDIAAAMPEAGHMINWVICGGESGPHARPLHPGWVTDLRDQCNQTGIAFHFKQWGEWLPAGQQGNGAGELPPSTQYHNFGHAMSARVGVKNAGRLLDSREWNEYPG
jgi:protein gp37